MTEVKDAASLVTTYAPLPELVRGYGIHMYATKKNDTFAYCAGRLVIIRSLADPSVSDYFAEHKSKVNVASFSPNGEWIASGDDEGKVLVWAVKSKIIKNTVNVNKKIIDICWSPDGQRIVAVGDGAESKARAFSWDTGNNIGTIDFHSKPILSCSYKPTRPFRVVTSSEDHWVNFYEGPPFKWAQSIKEYDKYVNCVRYSPDGNHFISVGGDRILMFEGKEGKKVKEFTDSKDGHKASILSFSWSPDGKSILTASADKTAKIWNVETGTVKKTFTFSKKPSFLDQQVSSLWHAGAKEEYLITISLSGAINYLDINNPDKPKRVVVGHMHQPQGLVIDKQNKLAYTTDDNGKLTQWNLVDGTNHWFEGAGHEKSIVGVALSADNTHVWTVGLDDKIRCNEAKGLTFNNDAVSLGGMPVAVAAARKDKDLVAVVLAQEKLVLIRNGKIVSTTEIGFRPNCLSFSNDDKEIAVGGNDSKVHLYAVDSKDSLTAGKVYSGHINRVLQVKYLPNGMLVSSDSNRNIFFWKDGEIQNHTGWTFHTSAVTGLAFPDDGRVVVSCSIDQDIIIWTDLKGFEHNYGKIVLSHPTGVENVAFLDSHTLVSTGSDRSVKVWRLKI